jgi:cation diffusion facilitator CzcD-associated flavoprotein CzcO
MPDTATLEKTPASKGATEHFDVLIVGAGISGIGAAYHLQDQSPGTSFVVLDAMEDFGGTWWMHRYPGIRSDSDLYTFGYRFKPWTGKPIATAEEIRTYMGEVIEENDLARHIRYKHRILSAEWSDETNLWTVHATRTDTSEDFVFTCGFLWMCQGYYRHSEGYTPDWPDMDKFKGDIIHPQTWPEGYDYKGKKVIVIGSGATTATIVPAMAPDCEHITVLQRSPTYFVPGRNENEVADFLRMLEVDENWIHEITRRAVLFNQAELTRRSAEEPDVVSEELIGGVKELLPEGYDVGTHFTPKYRPWRQRVAFVPEGDLFAGIKSGKASMVTDEIERFTENGILTKSGKELEADIIITATGFNLCSMGDIAFSVNGKPVDFNDTVTYRGMMFTGVPNMAWIFGYFRASWTLRVDMVGDFICRLLKHMQQKGAKKVSVALREEDKDMPILDWIDPDDFNPGYIMRNMHLLPKRGTKREWQHTQDYWAEHKEFPLIDLDDEAFVYE